MTAYARFLDWWRADDAGPLGVAVSGGSDSMALLLRLVRDVLPSHLKVATVNHGLRPEAQQEADFVAEFCAARSVEHQTLALTSLTYGPNLQARARDARYQALADWATGQGCRAVALGHTQTDVAETLLLRLARGSGLKGLAAMEATKHSHGTVWVRPLLDETRSTLQAELHSAGQSWCSDPSNEDPQFGRAKARQAMPALSEIGLTEDRLASTAHQFRESYAVIQAAVRDLLKSAVELDQGDVRIDPVQLGAALPEVRQRLLAELLSWVAGADYGPRLHSLKTFWADRKPATLHGVLGFLDTQGRLVLTREYNAVKTQTCPGDSIWDGRWQFAGGKPDQFIRALGKAGLLQCPDWRETGRDRRSVLATPALWQGEAVISAPLAGLEGAELRLIAAHPLENL